LIDWIQILAILALVLQSVGLLPTPPDPCDFAQAVAITSFDHATDAHLAARPATDADRTALRRLDGIYDWLGYEGGGFDRPTLEQDPIEVFVTLSTNEDRYIYLYDDLDPATDTQWVWAFRSLAAPTDANGEHLGLHDICASGGWPLAELAAVLSN